MKSNQNDLTNESARGAEQKSISAYVSPADILAFAAEGTRLTSSKLDAAHQDWWENQKNSPYWQIAQPFIKTTFLNQLLEARLKRRAGRIISDLAFTEEEGNTLFYLN